MTATIERAEISTLTVPGLKAELDEAGVEYRKKATKPELRSLLEKARADSAAQAEPEAEAETPATVETVEEEIGQAIALREKAVVPTQALPSSDEYAVLSTLAHRTFQTTFVPAAYRGREPDVFAAFLFGREIGLGPMMALRDIHMIDGRPALAAHRQLAKLREGGVVILESEATQERAMIRARRQDTGEVMTVEFTYAEAQGVDDGKLVAKKNWRSWRQDMLWARCVGRLTRRLGPDLLGGLPPYVAEEVADFSGYAVAYDEQGAPTFKEDRQENAGRTETPKTWAEINAWAEPYGPELGWRKWILDAAESLFQTTTWEELSPEQRKTLGQKASGAIIALRDAHPPAEFPPPTREEIQKAWASVLEGISLPGPMWQLSPGEAELGVPTYNDANGIAEEPAEAVEGELVDGGAPEQSDAYPHEPTAEEIAEVDALPFGED